MIRTTIIIFLAAISLNSCVSMKKYKYEVAKYDSLKTDYGIVEDLLKTCMTEKSSALTDAKNKQALMEEQIAELKATRNMMMNQLTDLSVISKQQAESIQKSLENIGSKDNYIQTLQNQMARKDSMNMALVLNLKGALGDVNDADVQVKVEGSAVLINLSDKMLFKSGSYEITPAAKKVLAKVALVLNAQPGIQFMVEGNTDNKSIKTEFIKDNWDLSVLRASSVARVLQTEYAVDPVRIIAAGRSEYHPMGSNDTDEGRSANRRTSIIILPALDQFFKMLEPK